MSRFEILGRCFVFLFVFGGMRKDKGKLVKGKGNGDDRA